MRRCEKRRRKEGGKTKEGMKEEETNVGYQNIPDLLSILCNSSEDDNDHSNYCSLLRAQPMPTTDFTAFNPPVVPVR